MGVIYHNLGMPRLRVPVRWLKEFVELGRSPKELVELLSNYGFEAGLLWVGEPLQGVRVGRLESGRLGLVDPRGRFLSFEALGMGSSTRPIELSQEYPVRSPILDWVDDWVIEVEVPANRGDLMSVMGLARELAGYLDEELKLPEFSTKGITGGAPELRLEIGAPEALSRYQAVVSKVTIGDASFELAWRLYLCGGRAVNSLVDLTNYLMYKYGQPLHAFDHGRLVGGEIGVRWARPGERLCTLDGVDRVLGPEDLVIADAQRSVALAGVIGGVDTEVSERTKVAVVECACFKPWAVRRTAQRHKLSTPAAQRFWMGVDPETSCAFGELLFRLEPGVQARLEFYPRREERVIGLRPARANRLLGVRLTRGQMGRFLNRLGFKVEEAERELKVWVPSFRRDIEEDVDLVEEIARIYGYHRIPSRFRLRGDRVGGLHPRSQALDRVRTLMIGQGFDEVQTLSFVDEARLKLFDRRKPLSLRNPISERLSALRLQLLPGLLEVVAQNLPRDNRNLRIFEIGKVFLDAPPYERIHLAGLLTGSVRPNNWGEKGRICDVFDLKGVVELLSQEMGVEGLQFISPKIPSPEAWISIGGERLGWLGGLRRELLAAFEIEVPVYGFELDLERLIGYSNPIRIYHPLPKFPAVVRDLSFLLDESIPAAQVEGLVRELAGPGLERLEIFDCFTSAQFGPGKKNLGLRLTFRSEVRTLNRAEVDGLIQKISGGLERALGAKLRGPKG